MPSWPPSCSVVPTNCWAYLLLGNSLINAASASLATVITFRLIGNDELALGIATITVTFAILVFSEATQSNRSHLSGATGGHHQPSADLPAAHRQPYRLVCQPCSSTGCCD